MANNSKSQSQSQSAPSLLTWIIGSAIIALLFCGAYYWATIKFVGGGSEGAEFGELFGGLSAFFTALAFGAVTWTMVLQRQDLALQLAELSQTRQEMVAQTKSFNQQSFENRFFEWLKLHHNIVDAMDIRRGERELYARRDCFKFFHSTLEAEYISLMEGCTGLTSSAMQSNEVFINHLVSACVKQGRDEKQILLSAYMNMYQRHQGDLGHYFRNLYNLVKFIDQSDMTDSEKRFYSKVIRAQLSSYELVMLFYNCISKMGHEKFFPLIETYALLKNMDFNLLYHLSHKAYFSPKAYGENQ